MQEIIQLESSLTKTSITLKPDMNSLPRSKSSLLHFFSKNAPFLLPLGIFLLALTVRLIYNLTVARNYTPVYDAALYDILAQKLLRYHCYCIHSHYETVSRAPLWPFLLATIYAIFGQHSLYGRLFYCLLGSFTCVFTYLLARDIFGWRVGCFVGLLASMYPGLFLYDGWLFSESLYTFFSMGFTYALFRLQLLPQKAVISSNSNFSFLSFLRQPIVGKSWLVCGAICLAGACLTRPNGSSLFALVTLWSLILLILKIWPWQVALKNTLVIVCLGTLLLVPWTYRNYLVSHHFVPVATGMGEVLLGSYNDRVSANGSWWLPPLGAKIHDDVGYTPDNDNQDTTRAFAWIHTHLSQMPSILFLHALHFWTPYHYSLGLPMEEFPRRTSSRILMALINVTTPFVFLFSLAGFFLTVRKYWQPLLLVYLVIAQTIILNIALYSTPRFRTPMEPLLVLLVGGVLWWIISKKALPDS